MYCGIATFLLCFVTMLLLRPTIVLDDGSLNLKKAGLYSAILGIAAGVLHYKFVAPASAVC
mgnify:CR=1 FL=1